MVQFLKVGAFLKLKRLHFEVFLLVQLAKVGSLGDIFAEQLEGVKFAEQQQKSLGQLTCSRNVLQ